MGLCCDMRCYNTPHLHQLGWASPVATLHKVRQDGGRTTTASCWGGGHQVCCWLIEMLHPPRLHAPPATQDNFPGGKWLSYTLPATITAERSFLRVRPDWYKSSAGNDFWLAFR